MRDQAENYVYHHSTHDKRWKRWQEVCINSQQMNKLTISLLKVSIHNTTILCSDTKYSEWKKVHCLTKTKIKYPWFIACQFKENWSNPQERHPGEFLFWVIKLTLHRNVIFNIEINIPWILKLASTCHYCVSSGLSTGLLHFIQARRQNLRETKHASSVPNYYLLVFTR